jgi:hypothetical protein
LLGEIHLAKSAATKSRYGSVGTDALRQARTGTRRLVQRRRSVRQRRRMLRMGCAQLSQSMAPLFFGAQTKQRLAERIGKVVRQAG